MFTNNQEGDYFVLLDIVYMCQIKIKKSSVRFTKFGVVLKKMQLFYAPATFFSNVWFYLYSTKLSRNLFKYIIYLLFL